jgi:hypothetical protein
MRARRRRSARRLLALAALLTAPTLLALGLAGCRRSSLLPRADGAAVVLVTPDSGGEPGVTALVEIEPNGTLATAQKLELGTAAALAVSGQLAAGDPSGKGKDRDVDLYRVMVPPAPASPALPGDGGGAAPPAPLRRRLSALVQPDASLAVTLEALDDAGQPLLAALGGPAGEVEGFPNLTVTPGIYFLKVRGAPAVGGAGSYRLTVRLLPLEAGEEIEPNGKSALSNELPAPGEAVGYFGWRRDQDWYRVPLAGVAEGSVLSADLEPVPGVAASLLVLDSAERKLTEARGRKEERVAVRNIRLPPGEPHLYLVARTDSGRNVDVRYNLRVRTELPKAGGELEPNDDAAHANPLADGTVLGYLGRGDVDVYRYSAAEARELDVEVEPPERVDIKVEVLREPDGLLLVRSDTGKRHEPERLPNLFAPGGSLLIRIFAAKGDGNADEPYRLTVASHPPEPGAEREPNGAAAAATPLPVGASGNGLIFPRGDIDFWQAALPSAPPDGDGQIAVIVTGIAGTPLELRVLTLGEKELGRFKIAGASTGPITNRVAAGNEPCCLVQIRDASGKAANFRDRYTVSVTR